MPIPKPNQGETQNEFISRFMANEAMLKEFPEEKQRAAVAHSTWEASQKKDELQHRAFSVRLDFKQDAYQETPEGYLMVDAYLTRAGIFDYRDEQGKLTRELRPGEEVFDFESLKTLQLQPVTTLHPDEMITPQNIKDYQVGVTGEVIKRDQNGEGDFVKMRLKITDPVTISQIKARKDTGLPVELSCGYDAHVIPSSGDHPKEGHYDAIQTQIRYNHVSIVPAGRAGEHVRLRFDKSQKEDYSMPVKFKRKAIKLDAFNMDEIDVQIPDEASAILDRLSAKLDEAIEVIQSQGNQIKEVKAQKTAAEAKIDQLSGSTKKIDELQAKLDQTTEELTKAKNDVTELSNMDSPRVQTMLKAKKDLEETADLLKVDRKDKSPKEIKIAIIKSVSPEFNHEGRSDEYINARYDSVVEFVIQAKSDANNNKLGEFIKQAQDSHTPKDPRADFIKQSQELCKAN